MSTDNLQHGPGHQGSNPYAKANRPSASGTGRFSFLRSKKEHRGSDSGHSPRKLSRDLDQRDSVGITQGWTVELNAKTKLRKRLPGWDSYREKKSIELREAILANRYHLIHELLREGADVNFCDDRFRSKSLLHLAAQNATSRRGNIRALEILLDAGACVDMQDARGDTPLHTAAAQASPEAIQCLLEYRASLTGVNEQGETPLHCAARSGSVAAVRVLMAAGVPNEEGKAKELPLNIAINAGNAEVVLELLRIEARLGPEAWADTKAKLLANFSKNRHMQDWITDTERAMQGGGSDSRRGSAVAPGMLKRRSSNQPKPMLTRPGSREFLQEKSMRRRRVSRQLSRQVMPRRAVVMRNNGSFGFVVVGGMEHGLLPVTAFAKDGRQPLVVSGELNHGDEIVSINGQTVAGQTCSEVAALLESCPMEAHLLVLPSPSNKAGRRITDLINDSKIDEDIKERVINAIKKRDRPVTTRKPQAGEEHGKDFNFVNDDIFQAMVDAGAFSSWEAKREHREGILRKYVAPPAGKDGAGTGAGAPAPLPPRLSVVEVAPPRLSLVTLGRNKDGIFGFGIAGGIEQDELPTVELVNQLNIVGGDKERGVSPGDSLLAVNGINVAGETHDAVLRIIRESGATVELLVYNRAANTTSSGGSDPRSGHQPQRVVPRRVSALLRAPDANSPELKVLKRDVLRTVYRSTVPCTTRPPRAGEVDGQDYCFMTEEAFMAAVRNNEFLEWGRNKGHLYGTKPGAARKPRSASKDSLVDEASSSAPSAAPMRKPRPSLTAALKKSMDQLSMADMHKAQHQQAQHQQAQHQQAQHQQAGAGASGTVRSLPAFQGDSRTNTLRSMCSPSPVDSLLDDAAIIAASLSASRSSFHSLRDAPMPRDSTSTPPTAADTRASAPAIQQVQSSQHQPAAQAQTVEETVARLSEALACVTAASHETEASAGATSATAKRETESDPAAAAQSPDLAASARVQSSPSPLSGASATVVEDDVESEQEDRVDELPIESESGTEDESDEEGERESEQEEDESGDESDELALFDILDYALAVEFDTEEQVVTPLPGLNEGGLPRSPADVRMLAAARRSYLVDLLTETERHIDDMFARDGFSDEWRELTPVGVRQDKSISQRNRAMNRYTNVLAYDHSRVRLKSGDADGYINANYIGGAETPTQYIATQGPLPSSFDNFWRMVWQERTEVVVMVTQEVEGGRTKCHRYWPEDPRTGQPQTRTYGNMRVSMIGADVRRLFVMRRFELTNTDQPDEAAREVVQFAFTSWPDHGVPQDTTDFLRFRRDVRKAVRPSAGPMIVHCSAGVGRSGTFIAVDQLLQGIEMNLYAATKDARTLEKADHQLDILGVVNKMRLARNLMVQTQQQYEFVHLAVARAIAGFLEVHPLDETDFQSVVEAGSEYLEVLVGGSLEKRGDETSVEVEVDVSAPQKVVEVAVTATEGCDTVAVAVGKAADSDEEEEDFATPQDALTAALPPPPPAVCTILDTDGNAASTSQA